jgi:hypothetical protein
MIKNPIIAKEDAAGVCYPEKENRIGDSKTIG